MSQINPITEKPDRIAEPLYVVTSISNPWRYRSRWALYHDFARHIEQVGARLVTVEVAYGEREHAVQAGDVRPETGGAEEPRATGVHSCHPSSLQSPASGLIQLRTQHELWHKENALNIGFSRLPADWKYAAWIDADVTFARPDIVTATIHALQHWPVVQMWSRALDLAPNGHPFAHYRSFADCHVNRPEAGGRRREDVGREDVGRASHLGYGSATAGGYWHSGYAWAIRRDAFNAIGGLIDFAPLGAADYFMSWGLLGQLSGRIYRQIKDRSRASRGYHQDYVEALAEWERKAAALRKNLGCVEGLLTHAWHGKKRQRGYNVRENVLIDNQFNPRTDLRRDWQGLWQLHDDGSERSVRLRDQFRAYFRSRDEDSIDYDGREL
jgi:hypothetical protein